MILSHWVGQTRLLPRSHLNKSRMQFSAESDRLSSSLVLILKQITIVKWCKRSSIYTTLTKFLKLRSESCTESGCCCPAGSRDFSVFESSPLNSHWTNGDLVSQHYSATSGWSWESSLGERTIRTRQTETGNQVGLFMSTVVRSNWFVCERAITTLALFVVHCRPLLLKHQQMID